MANYAVISREEAAKGLADIRPPSATPEVQDAPKSAAPGSHPGRPIESDPEALAAYQGRDKIEARQATRGSWHENAFGQPVWVAEEAGGGGGGGAQSRTSGEPLEIPAPRTEPKAQPEHPRGERKG